MKLVTTTQMREIEEEADAGGYSYDKMMDRAGRAVADAIQSRLRVQDLPILILVGPGNNGGDGLVAARHLHRAGASISLYLWNRKTAKDPNFKEIQDRNIPIVQHSKDKSLKELKRLLKDSRIVVDALLGTGASRPIGPPLSEILSAVAARREGTRPPHLVALDVPSGLNGDDGSLDPAAVAADLTVTLALPKWGLYLFPGAAATGEVVVGDIGIPSRLASRIKDELATDEMVRQLLPDRPLDAHKGTFGKALIVAGSANYTGAAYLASTAAARVGAGLVTLALAQNLHPVLAAKLTEVTFLLLPHDLGALVPEASRVLAERLPGYRALLLGPGLGQEPATVQFVHRLLGLQTAAGGRGLGFLSESEAGQEQVSLPGTVLDADALNALAEA
ncbi:MAG: NAD(P)H-hydrate epimerase, partial [Anaerolineae bacterium]